MKPLSITHVVWTLHRAGAERVVLDLARESLARGVHVRVIAVGGGGEMESAFREAGIDLCIAPATLTRMHRYRWIRHELRQHPPMILHTHLGGDIWGALGAFGLRGVQRFSTAHNDDQDEPMHIRLARGFALRSADHVICVSERVRDHVQTRFGVSPATLSVIRNGLFLPSMAPRVRPWHDIPRLLAVGRLVEQKGQDILLRALAQISHPWELRIAGDGPKRQELSDLATRLGIAPRVTFLGTVSTMDAVYRDADVFVFPSRWEGQGIAMLEAMRVGLPVIASDLPVFHETFDEGSCRFVTVDDVPAWTRAIAESLRMPRIIQEQVPQAFEQLRHWFSLSGMVDAYFALYNAPRL